MKPHQTWITALVCLMPVVSGQLNSADMFTGPGEQSEMLRQHNAWRSRSYSVAREKVASEAANMRELEWDTELAQVALTHVSTCNYAHDTTGYYPNGRAEPPVRMGQNIYKSWGNTNVKYNINGAMTGWCDEEIDRHVNVLKQDPIGAGTAFDHVSQVMWAETNKIGCAYSICNGNELFISCNYVTPGNMLGKSWFISGPPCTECPDDANYCTSQGLCSAHPQTSDATPEPTPAKTKALTPTPSPAPSEASTGSLVNLGGIKESLNSTGRNVLSTETQSYTVLSTKSSTSSKTSVSIHMCILVLTLSLTCLVFDL